MRADREIRDMPHISPIEAYNFVTFCRDKPKLNNELLHMLYHPYDYTTTRKERWHDSIERYIYSEYLRPFWVSLTCLRRHLCTR